MDLPPIISMIFERIINKLFIVSQSCFTPWGFVHCPTSVKINVIQMPLESNPRVDVRGALLYISKAYDYV